METRNLSTAELERHLLWQDQVLKHLVRDFGEKGKQSRIYQETLSCVGFLEMVISKRKQFGHGDD